MNQNKKKTTTQVLPLIALVCLALAGCGGGSGANDTTAAPVVATQAPVLAAAVDPVAPIESAISKLYTEAPRFDRSETDAQGATYLFSRAYSAPATTTFENANANAVDILATTTKNGAPYSTTSQTDYFQTGPYRLLGRKTGGSSLYLVASNQQALPVSGKAGDSGKFYDAVTYDSPARNTVVSTSSHVWQITPDSASSITFCVVSTTSIPQLAGTTTRSDCYRINTAGAVTSVAFPLPN